MQMTQAALSDVNRKYNLGYTWDDMLDMQKGTRAGAAYLALLLDEYFPGDIDKATRAYNSGMGNVKWNPLAGQVYLLKVKSYESINS